MNVYEFIKSKQKIIPGSIRKPLNEYLQNRRRLHENEEVEAAIKKAKHSGNKHWEKYLKGVPDYHDERTSIRAVASPLNPKKGESLSILEQIILTLDMKPSDGMFFSCIDYGGGKYNDNKRRFRQLGIRSDVIDIHNRSTEHNQRIENKYASSKPDIVTVFKVLNVIMSQAGRKRVVEKAFDLVKPGGLVVFQIYNAGKKSETQVSEPPSFYMKEIENWTKRKPVFKRDDVIAYLK